MSSAQVPDPRVTVLVAEDEPSIAALIQDVVTRQKGWDVHIVDKGEDAMDAIRRGLVPDLLITDMGLAGNMNGLELIDQVRGSSHTLNQLPVVMISGTPDASVEQQVKAKKGEYLKKPTSLQALDTAITQAFTNMGLQEPFPNPPKNWQSRTGGSGPSAPGLP